MTDLKEMSNEELIDSTSHCDCIDCVDGRAELLSRLNDLCCCGNCSQLLVGQMITYCTKISKQVNRHLYCDKWQSDGMTRSQREIK